MADIYLNHIASPVRSAESWGYSFTVSSWHPNCALLGFIVL